MKTKILIIGGMGPQASLDLHQRIITRAVADGISGCGDFPMIVHFSLPASDESMSDPEKLRATFNEIASQLPRKSDMHFTHIVIACNTMHAFIDDFEQLLGVRPLSLMDVTISRTKALDIERVGLLASPTTIKNGLFGKPLSAIGMEMVALDEEQMERTEDAIKAVISGELQAQTVTEQIGLLRSEGCERVILGCTELSVLNTAAKFKNCIDPLDCAVDEIFRQDNRV